MDNNPEETVSPKLTANLVPNENTPLDDTSQTKPETAEGKEPTKAEKAAARKAARVAEMLARKLALAARKAAKAKDAEIIKHTRIDNTIAKVANLSVSVLAQWDLNYPNFVCTAFRRSELQQSSDELAALLVESVDKVNDKRQSSRDLVAINQKINQSVQVLRAYFKANEMMNNINIDNEYNRYGFEVRLSKKGNRTFIFPRDNDSRAAAIQMVVSEMQKPSGLYGSKDLGLTHWLQLQTAHTAAWTGSNNSRARISAISKQKKILTERVKDMLTILRANIKAHFYKQNAPQTLRSFGFLKENF